MHIFHKRKEAKVATARAAAGRRLKSLQKAASKVANTSSAWSWYEYIKKKRESVWRIDLGGIHLRLTRGRLESTHSPVASDARKFWRQNAEEWALCNENTLGRHNFWIVSCSDPTVYTVSSHKWFFLMPQAKYDSVLGCVLSMVSYGHQQLGEPRGGGGQNKTPLHCNSRNRKNQGGPISGRLFE